MLVLFRPKGQKRFSFQQAFRFFCLLQSFLLVFPPSLVYADCPCDDAKPICNDYKNANPGMVSAAEWGQIGQECRAIDHYNGAIKWDIVGASLYTAAAAACAVACGCAIMLLSAEPTIHMAGEACYPKADYACSGANVVATVEDMIALGAQMADTSRDKKWWEQTQLGMGMGSNLVGLGMTAATFGMGGKAITGFQNIAKELQTTAARREAFSKTAQLVCLMEGMLIFTAVSKWMAVPGTKDAKCQTCASVKNLKESSIQAAYDAAAAEEAALQAQQEAYDLGYTDALTAVGIEPTASGTPVPTANGSLTAYAVNSSGYVGSSNYDGLHSSSVPLSSTSAILSGGVATTYSGGYTDGNTQTLSALGTMGLQNSMADIFKSGSNPFPSGVLNDAIHAVPAGKVFDALPNMGSLPAALDGMGSSFSDIEGRLANNESPTAIVNSMLPEGAAPILADMFAAAESSAKKNSGGSGGSYSAADISGTKLKSSLDASGSTKVVAKTGNDSREPAQAVPSPLAASRIRSRQGDIWHSGTSDSLFRIVSDKINQVKGRIAQLNWTTPYNRSKR